MSDDKDEAPASQLNKAFNFGKEHGIDGAISAFCFAHYVPLPPSTIKRIRTGLEKVLGAGFEVAVAKINATTSGINFKTKQQEKITATLAAAGVKNIATESPELASAIAFSYVEEERTKFENRFAIVKNSVPAIEPPKSSNGEAAEIDPDWFAQFKEIAGRTHDVKMQELMGRVLAGEISNPGAYSMRSVLALTTMPKEVAEYFRVLCTMSVRYDAYRYVITDLYPGLLGDGAAELGMPYDALLELEEYGLVKLQKIGVSPDDGSAFFHIVGSRKYRLQPANFVRRPKLAVIPFRSLGVELARLIQFDHTLGCEERYKNFFGTAEWELTDMDIGDEVDGQTPVGPN